MQYLIGLIPGVGGNFGRIGKRIERKVRENTSKWIYVEGNTENCIRI
jgi:methyl coenzyme M reductase subunit C-like uncharacterized protein (methanogenesis marker protein 7)